MESNSLIPNSKKLKRIRKKKKKKAKKGLGPNTGAPVEMVGVHDVDIWALVNRLSQRELSEQIPLNNQGQNTAKRPQVERTNESNQASPSEVLFVNTKRKPSETVTSNTVPNVSSEANSMYCTVLGSDRPTRFGLRNETHHDGRGGSNRPLYDVCASSVGSSRSRSRSPKTPVLPETYSDYEGNAASSYNVCQIHRQNILAISDDDSVEYVPGEDENKSIIDLGEYIDYPIYVGIRNHTPMSKVQMISVSRDLNMAIIKIGINGTGPRFSHNSHKNGWILITCEDHESREWLEKTVPKLNPWPGARLSIIPQSELETHILTTVLIPWKEGVTVPQALELLRVQNQGVETINWKIINATKKYTGLIVLLSIDRDSYNTIKNMNFMANLGASKIEFKFDHDNNES